MHSCDRVEEETDRTGSSVITKKFELVYRTAPGEQVPRAVLDIGQMDCVEEHALVIQNVPGTRETIQRDEEKYVRQVLNRSLWPAEFTSAGT